MYADCVHCRQIQYREKKLRGRMKLVKKKIDPKVMNMLQKLLATASGGANEHEAKVAMDKAQALMQRHNISTHDVACDGSGASVKDSQIPYGTKIVPTWKRQLSAAVAHAFHGEVVTVLGPHPPYLHFVAAAVDLEIILDLYYRLSVLIPKMRRDFVVGNNCGRLGGNSYQRGLVAMIRLRLRDLRKATDPAPDGKKNAYGYSDHALVAVKDNAVQQHKAQLFPKTVKPPKPKGVLDINSYKVGLLDGKNINLNRSISSKGGVYVE